MKVVYLHYKFTFQHIQEAIRNGSIDIDLLCASHSFPQGFRDAFEEEGFKVVIDYRTGYFFSSPFFYRNYSMFRISNKLRKLLGSLESRMFNRKLLKRVVDSKADIYFTEINPVVNSWFLDLLRQRGIKSVEWFGLFPFQFPDSSNQIRQIPNFDLIVSGSRIEDHFPEMYGPKKFLYVSPAIAPNIYRKVALNEEDMQRFSADVSFVGGVGPSHKNRYPILEVIAQNVKDVKLYGYGTEHVPGNFTFQKKYRGQVWGNDYVKILNASKINLNLFLDDYGKVSGGVNQRALEIPSCGGFQLCQYIPNIEEFFVPDMEIVCFHSLDDMVDKIKYYLTHEEERKKIAQAGYEKVMKFYTYNNQMKQILSNLS